MTGWLEHTTALLSAHPHWAGVFVLRVAVSEAVVVGYIIPSTPILLTLGGLAGAGQLPLWPLLGCAAGAVVGDGLSFWLGYRYRDTLRNRWPFSRRPDLLARGEAFFHLRRRHVAKAGMASLYSRIDACGWYCA